MSNPGQIGLGIVGGIVGAAIGGPTGAAYGLQIGLAVGNVVSPTQLPGTFGPRLDDNRTTTAELGAPIVELWGIDAVAGTVIWLGDLVEHSNTEEVGGKGGPEGENTTYTYTQSIAIGLCRGPHTAIRRVWENGKLVYDVRAPLAEESAGQFAARIEAAVDYAQGFHLYEGNEEQLPDPTIELKEGVGNVPAYRGLMYIVYTDRLLRDDQGRRHPSFKFEVVGGNPPLQSLVVMVTTASTVLEVPEPYALLATPATFGDPDRTQFLDTYDSAEVHATDVCGLGTLVFALGKISESQYWARISFDSGATFEPVSINPATDVSTSARHCSINPAGRIVVTGTNQPSGNFDIVYSDNDGALWLPCTTLDVETDFRFGVVRYVRERDYWLCGGLRGIAKSADGFVWTSVFSGVSINPVQFLAADGRVVALTGTLIFESLDDGETWAEVFEAESPHTCIAFGVGLWVRYVTGQGFTIAGALAGPWSEPSQAFPGWGITDMYFDGGKFVAVGGTGGVDPETLILTSGDGFTWSLASVGDVQDAFITRINQSLP